MCGQSIGAQINIASLREPDKLKVWKIYISCIWKRRLRCLGGTAIKHGGQSWRFKWLDVIQTSKKPDGEFLPHNWCNYNICWLIDGICTTAKANVLICVYVSVHSDDQHMNSPCVLSEITQLQATFCHTIQFICDQSWIVTSNLYFIYYISKSNILLFTLLHYEKLLLVLATSIKSTYVNIKK